MANLTADKEMSDHMEVMKKEVLEDDPSKQTTSVGSTLSSTPLATPPGPPIGLNPPDVTDPDTQAMLIDIARNHEAAGPASAPTPPPPPPAPTAARAIDIQQFDFKLNIDELKRELLLERQVDEGEAASAAEARRPVFLSPCEGRRDLEFAAAESCRRSDSCELRTADAALQPRDDAREGSSTTRTST